MIRKNIYKFASLLIFIIAVVLLLVGLSNESFGFNVWWFFAVLLLGNGILFLVQSAMLKSGVANLISGCLTVLGVICLCAALKALWFWYVCGGLLALALVAAVRMLSHTGKWDKGDNQ